ncbi:MAG TPA: hypothetical protein VGR53_04750 [Nitrososphaerales archaeon]|nr:hypothetical protein [Nitrososphaerales archaeon]
MGRTTETGQGANEEPALGSLELQRRYTAHAIPYNRSFMFYLPKALIPNHKNKGDVIELWVSHGKRPRVQFPLYTAHDPASRRAIVSLFQIAAKQKHRILIHKVSLYNIEEFVRDFNVTQPKGFEDVRFGLVESRLELKIGGIALQLENPSLKAFQGEAVLNLGIGGACELRLRKGVHGFRIQRMPHREPILSLRARPDALIIRYRISKKWKHEATRIVELPRNRLGTSDRMPSSPEIRLISKPMSFEGSYLVELPEDLEKDARDRIRTATSFAEYSMLRGEIGEAIIGRILRMVGCVEIANHPLSKSMGFRDSEKKGPDSLRLVPGGGTAYFENKWWKQFNMALWDARQIVKKYCERFPGPDGFRVESGYVAVLDWDIGATVARLHVERVV